MNKFRIFVAFVVVAIIVGLRFTPVGSYLTFDNLIANKGTLHALANEYNLLFPMVYVLVYALAVAISFPGAAILTMAGGFVFGTLPATLYVNIGATTGAAGAFLASRYLLGSYVQEKYSERLKRFNAELKANGANYLFSLRLVPVFPFFVINLLAGLTKVSLPTFMWTTSLGIIPGSIAYSFAGEQLNYIESPGDILSGRILLAFAALIMLALLPVIYRKIKGR